jgi:hypothetical protein
VVDNYKLRELLDRANTKYKRMIQYVNADHKLMSDGEYFQLAMQDITSFIDQVIQLE